MNALTRAVLTIPPEQMSSTSYRLSSKPCIGPLSDQFEQIELEPWASERDSLPVERATTTTTD